MARVLLCVNATSGTATFGSFVNHSGGCVLHGHIQLLQCKRTLILNCVTTDFLSPLARPGATHSSRRQPTSHGRTARVAQAADTAELTVRIVATRTKRKLQWY